MKRFVLTEDERRNISNLHKNYITEQTVQDVVVQPGVFNQRVLDLQNHLNTKFQSGLVADGKLGPKTVAATQAALTKAASDNSKTVVDKQPLKPLETGIKTPEIIQNTKTSSAPDADNEAKPLNT
jgi:peptidoglycan hydrolase-like protein with peptidoglycan-binding domain